MQRSTDAAATGRDGYVGYIGHNTAVEYYNNQSLTTAGLYKYGDLCLPGTFTYAGCDDGNVCTDDECTLNPPEVIWRCQNFNKVCSTELTFASSVQDLS